MKRVLLYKTGETAPELIPHIGDYEDWFSLACGEQVTLHVHRGFHTPRTHFAAYDAVIITGSPRSLVEPEPWMDDAAAEVRAAADAGVPVLGVCFGHQLVGYAFGARVRMNPRGWEVGTTSVRLTERGVRDPLFRGLPEELRVNQSHRDEVVELPQVAACLAAGSHTEMQAIAVGDHVRGVQFHPEMSAAVIRRLIEFRYTTLRDDFDRFGRGCPLEVARRVEETPQGALILANFCREFLR